MSRSRKEIWLAVIVLGVGLIPAGLLGLWTYMSITAVQLHPNPEETPSLTDSAPAPKWAKAVEEGRQIVRASLTEKNLPGLSVAVGVGGEIVWAEGFGSADLEKHVPVAPETSFRIGTASTPLTSAAVGVLVEEGKLNLDEPIQTYVPAFVDTYSPPSGRTFSPVTLRHLMAHTAGVPNDGGDEGPLFSRECKRPVDALQYFRGYERELRFEPGTEYRYSSYGWILVSAAVETVSGEPFLTFMQKRIFEPLGMAGTTANSATPHPKQATSYFPRFAADPVYGLHLTRPVDYSCYAGASVFVSTPSDLVRFGMAINKGTLLKPATVQLLQTSQRLPSGEETGYGLGWDLESIAIAGGEARWAGHDGTLFGGMAVSFITVPEHDVVVALTSNISYADTEAAAVRIAQAFVEGATRSLQITAPTIGRS